MRKGKTPKKEHSEVRRRAEEFLRKKSDDVQNVPADDVQKLVHELQVHQIQLEMQNEELRKVQLELEESRSRYYDLYDFAPVGYFTLDEKRLIREVNLAGANLLGTERKHLIGKRFSRFIAPDDQRIYDSHLKDVLETNNKQTCELKLQKKDGEPFHAQLESIAARDAKGLFNRSRTTISDITERKRAQQELFNVQRLESIGILAGGIAHDFNNILAAIVGNISLAKVYLKRGSRVLDLLEQAEKACSRAQQLTQQLMTFSKGGAPVKRTASITEVLKETADFALRGSKVRCDFAIPDDLWPVEIDTGQISQVINNVVINAAQAMPEGGTIEVSAENILIGEGHGLIQGIGRFVKVSVQDQGTGIPEENLSKIFDPYFTTKQEGTGLGLATAHSIIKRHDGLLTVESQLGTGTTFQIYLPASEKMILQEKSKERGPLGGKGKILVMDDEQMVREAAGNMLEHLGYQVEFANDGIEAIELYSRAVESGKPFDAILMDLTVPGGMGGGEVINKLKDIHPQTKAIVSSGYSNDPIMSHFKDFGFSGVVAKPYRIDELSRVLREVINGKSDDNF